MGPLSSFYRFRVGDYRLLAEITPETHTVLIVHIGHRRDVYRDEG
jgi:mRNA interferase RelE/StbE